MELIVGLGVLIGIGVWANNRYGNTKEAVKFMLLGWLGAFIVWAIVYGVFFQ